MEALQELVLIALRASILLIVLAIGLDATREDLTYVLKRRGLLLRSLLSINVIVPAFAALLVVLLPLNSVVKIGMVLMAISPFPPLLPGKELKLGGRKPYVYGLLVAVSLLAIVIVPLTVALLSAAFPANAAIVAPGSVAKQVLLSVFVPLAIGMAIRLRAPAFAARVQPHISKVATLMLVIGVVPVIIAVLPAIWHLIGNGSVLAMTAIVAVGLAAGHFLGGPDPHDRITLAISSASRHPGIALLITTGNFNDSHVKASILLFLLVGLIVAIPYQVWYKRHYLFTD